MKILKTGIRIVVSEKLVQSILLAISLLQILTSEKRSTHTNKMTEGQQKVYLTQHFTVNLT